MWTYKKYRQGVLKGHIYLGQPIPDEYCIKLRWLLNGFMRWLGIKLIAHKFLYNAYIREMEKNEQLTKKLEEYEKNKKKN